MDDETYFYSNSLLFEAAIITECVFSRDLLPIKMVHGQHFPWTAFSHLVRE